MLEVIGLGSVTATPILSQARISSRRARSGAVAAGDFFFRFTRRLCCRDQLGGSDHGHPARKIARPKPLNVELSLPIFRLPLAVFIP